MTLKARIQEDMKSAMRAGEKDKLANIRMVMAAIKQREVDERIELDDAQVLSVIDKMVKQRRESITQFAAGGRADLVAKEEAELRLLECLPARATHRQRARRPDQRGGDRHRCRVHQGHGQGHGRDQGQGRRPRRHGRGGRTYQSAALHLSSR